MDNDVVSSILVLKSCVFCYVGLPLLRKYKNLVRARNKSYLVEERITHPYFKYIAF